MGIYTIYYPIWKEALLLAWPVFLNHIFTTAMRTTDMLLMGFFGPAAVTAVGLGDVWERIVLRIGLGLGAGSISLISQESGIDAKISARNAETVLTQILITGAIAGIPFMIIGWLIPEQLIEILGAAPEVIVLAAQYLLIIFSAAPFRIISLISARALQGSGDTRTPMIIGIISNVVNIGLSAGLALGIGFFPELGVIGVGWGTFTAKFIAAILYIIIFLLPRSKLNLRYPREGWDFTITKQLLIVSIPRSLQGGYQSLIAFPFNSLVLLFGTEAAAAYHIARRIQQQLMAPLHRSYGTVATILTGNRLGQKGYQDSRKVAKGMLWLTAITITFIGTNLFIFAPGLVKIFTEDAATIPFAVGFLRALSLGAPIIAVYRVLSGVLTGAGDTKTPFYGMVISQTLFKMGLSYILSVTLGLNITGIFIGLICDYIVQTFWVLRRFRTNKWITDAREMINDRHRKAHSD
ncbi:MAG: MATE family efflux transporter [Bacillota bacterium]